MLSLTSREWSQADGVGAAGISMTVNKGQKKKKKVQNKDNPVYFFNRKIGKNKLSFHFRSL